MSVSRKPAWQGKVFSPAYFVKPRKSKAELRAELARAAAETARLNDDQTSRDSDLNTLPNIPI